HSLLKGCEFRFLLFNGFFEFTYPALFSAFFALQLLIFPELCLALTLSLYCFLFLNQFFYLFFFLFFLDIVVIVPEIGGCSVTLHFDHFISNFVDEIAVMGYKYNRSGEVHHGSF